MISLSVFVCTCGASARAARVRIYWRTDNQYIKKLLVTTVRIRSGSCPSLSVLAKLACEKRNTRWQSQIVLRKLPTANVLIWQIAFAYSMKAMARMRRRPTRSNWINEKTIRFGRSHATGTRSWTLNLHSAISISFLCIFHNCITNERRRWTRKRTHEEKNASCLSVTAGIIKIAAVLRREV